LLSVTEHTRSIGKASWRRQVSDADIGRVAADFVVSSKDLSPDEITELVGLQPVYSHNRGSPIYNDFTGKQVGRRRANYWRYGNAVRPASKCLDEHIRDLVEVLEPHAARIRRLAMRDAERNDVYVWTLWESSGLVLGAGPILSAETSRIIGVLGIELHFGHLLHIRAWRLNVGRHDIPEFWPLLPGALTADLLQPFARVGYEAVAQAHRLGFLEQGELSRMISTHLFPTEPALLRTFLRTASYIDRRLDISEELQRLAREDRSAKPPLWMLVARIIVEHYRDAASALSTLQDLYQWCDAPSALSPYTLFGRPNPDGRSHAEQIVRELDAMLRKSGV
jgi:hypothetical protein